MNPNPDTQPEQPTAVTNSETKNLDPNKPYVLVLPGAEVGAVLTALDAAGRGVGADRGAFFWMVRADLKQQLMDEVKTEGEAAGLIAGRDAQRAEARAAVLKEDAAKATADKTAAKRGKK